MAMQGKVAGSRLSPLECIWKHCGLKQTPEFAVTEILSLKRHRVSRLSFKAGTLSKLLLMTAQS